MDSYIMLYFIGLSINAQTHFSKGERNSWINVNVGWGFAILFSVQATWNISGGQLNPAVSVMLWTFGKITFPQVIFYSIAQTVGAFLGAAATYIEYFDAFRTFDPNFTVTGPNATAGIFGSYPSPFVSMAGGFTDQAIGTGILALCVAIVIDARNKIPHYAAPLYLAFAVMMIGTAFGLNIGYPINPARDFGPRLFTFFFYGSSVFTYPTCIWWIMPIVGPILGAVLGAWMYQFFAGSHIPDEKESYISVQQDEVVVKN
uniref:Aquaporin-9 n=1 Tax=Syphacia muris TaxID=451379 RepID=A0A0N5AF67_9BILA